MKEMWDKRYSEEKFLYGTDANRFFEEELSKLKAASILLPGDGEGRNAAFAAKSGWQVSAFDYSEEAVKNAKAFLASQSLEVNFFQASILERPNVLPQYHAVASLYLHLPFKDRKVAHRYMADSILPGGHLLMEVFSKKQLGRKSGGPSQEDMLYDITEFEQDFHDLEILQLQEQEIELNEGPLHQGKAMVIRFVGRKKDS